MVYVKYPEGILGKVNWWVAIPNKPHGAPKDKDNLELAYQQYGMTTMNVDNVITTILVGETAQANDVDGHDWGDDHNVDGEHDDDYEEDEVGKWEEEVKDTDGDDEGDMTLQSDDDNDDDVSHNG